MKKNLTIFGIICMLLFSTLFTSSVFGVDYKNIENQYSLPMSGSFLNNSPPETPGIPGGPDYGEVTKLYRFYTNTTDVDGDKVKYGWDFTGDKVVDKWTNFYNSGVKVSGSWEWWNPGTYNISVKAEDIHGAQSNFSEVLAILINTPPMRPPTPSGPTGVYRNLKYNYYSWGFDIDGDQLWHMWDLGNNFTDWYGPYEPEEACNITAYWNHIGTYDLKARCKDIHGAIGEWSNPIPITVSDLIDIRIPIINIGKVNAYVKNLADVNLQNVSWNISVKRNRIIREIDVLNNDVFRFS